MKKTQKTPKTLYPLSPRKAYNIKIVCHVLTLGVLSCAGWLSYLLYEQFKIGSSLLILKYRNSIKIMITNELNKNIATGSIKHWVLNIWLAAIPLFFITLFLILLIHDKNHYASKRLEMYYSEKKKENSQREDRQIISKYKTDESHADAPDIIDTDYDDMNYTADAEDI